MLSDGDLLRNLLGHYCDLVDAADWDGVGALFASGRLATEDGTTFASGAQEVAAFYRGSVQLHDASPRTKHLVSNVVLALSDDGLTAQARSSYLVLQAVHDAGRLQPLVTGRYVDRFDRVEVGGDWTWRERRFAIDMAGDLSAHLRITY